MQRRQFTRLLGATAAAATLPLGARAQAIDQPKFLYGFPAGSAGDIVCRRVAEKVAGTPYARNAAIVEKQSEASPMVQQIGDRLAHLAARRQAGGLLAQESLEFGDERP